MAAAGGRARGRGRGRGASRDLPTITWPGTFGPFEYLTPVDEFPVEGMASFLPPRYLRPYDDRKDEWPNCLNGEPCLVQMYDDYGDGGRRFFRCPYGHSYFDEGNCRYSKWVDPPIHEHTQEYIHYLQCKIFDLKQRVESLEADADANPFVFSLEDDPKCPDPWCKCPYHPKKDDPPSPPSSTGAGSSQFSRSQFY